MIRDDLPARSHLGLSASEHDAGTYARLEGHFELSPVENA
jgi:hypothetical protein